MISCLLERQIEPAIQWLPSEARTARAAAEQLAVPVGAIANSLVLLCESDPLLVLASGANKVDLGLLSEYVGGPVALARGRRVREITGQPIGGVAPVGHPVPIPTLIDPDLGKYETVWASAGHPRAVFGSDLDRLAAITDGVVLGVAGGGLGTAVT
ncbi:YbaK/EbsC family protein [Nocardia sp. NPDC003345]